MFSFWLILKPIKGRKLCKITNLILATTTKQTQKLVTKADTVNELCKKR